MPKKTPTQRTLSTGIKSGPSLSYSSFILDEHQRNRVRSGEFDDHYSRLKDFFQADEMLTREIARKTIDALILSERPEQLSAADKLALGMSWNAARKSLKSYATLHENHINDISQLIESIEAYADDSSRTRPLNFMMLASPGAGKSHFIDCIAQKLASRSRNVVGHSFNMASMLSPEELTAPLDNARNSKVEDKLPLLFLDEFDTSPSNYGLLLPLLWDGSISLGHRNLKLGKLIVILAGSSRLLPETLSHAKSMRSVLPQLEGANSKLIDLLSRINGSVIAIPPLNQAPGVDSRALDKIAISVQLLIRRFGPELRQVPLALLQLIGQLRFRYDVRSISHLIDLIPRINRQPIIDLSAHNMPPQLSSVTALRESSLIYHLIDDEDNAHGIVNTWHDLAKHDSLVPVNVAPIIPSPSEEGIKLAIAYGMSQFEHNAS